MPRSLNVDCTPVGGRMRRQGEKSPKLLFALPPLHAKPPSVRLRNAIVDAAKRLETDVSRAAVVVAGSGFGAAVHRGALTGILALLRPKLAVKVGPSVRDALHYLVGADSPAVASLERICIATVARNPLST